MNTIALTEQDLILAAKLSFTKNRAYRMLVAKKWRYILTGAVIFSFCFKSFFIDKQTSPYEFIHSLILTAGISFFILYLPALILSSKLNIKRTWKKNKILHLPYTLKWDENHLFIESSLTKSQVEWHFFCNMAQNESYILAYQSQYRYNLTPKRFFENSEEIQDFLNHLEAGIKKK